jgi:hypothetical protein
MMQQRIKILAKNLAKQFAPLDRLLQERDQLHAENARLKGRFGTQLPYVPNGHYYSPVPSFEELRRDEHRIFASPPPSLPGIDLRPETQLQLLNIFAGYYKELPFSEHKRDGFRYFYENPAYSYSDAIFLHCIIRHTKPKRIIEVGSGYSSCVTLDTNEHFFGNSIDCTFVEPYPELLLSLLKPDDLPRIRVLDKKLQDVDLSIFQTLGANDILFIDSTHVSKTGSDVNRIFFDILPTLAEGVYIHFHDVFYPFEYPKVWVYEGRAWNEDYMLRAFLQYNSAFEIVCFNTFLEHFFHDFFEKHMPLCLKNPGGSIWLHKR